MEEEEYNGSENIQDKLQEFFGKLPDDFSILEEQVDVDIQMKYFEQAKSQNREFEIDDILARDAELYDDKIDIKTKKELLILLAGIDKPEAFRKIERYKKTVKQAELYDWACIAYHESKMLLESSLLDKNQIFISTGMGGKGNLLRYFVIIISENENEFSETQKKLITSEIEYSLKKYNAEIEIADFDNKYAMYTCLIPLEAPIKDIFQSAIDECNELGNFINDNFIVTNVKKLSSKEIDEFLEKVEKDGGQGDIEIGYS